MFKILGPFHDREWDCYKNWRLVYLTRDKTQKAFFKRS